MGFGFVVERFGLFLRLVANQPLSASQRGVSLWLGVTLMLLAGSVAIVSARQFRAIVRELGEQEIPQGYWTGMGVWLNVGLALIALVLAIYFVVGS